ncbi:glycosyltransferase family 2 protein [Winogradskyella flava]|uniref:Glycosyltransferase n=1 Tax=Winogradskyella flava TaxID=1884876 RepID=A0A842IVX7_9FLAO|nr:glycosyltransferase [Winogradskyella flava]MBC2846104.1 glycosyltransferase [Winogradskyella flava]
MKLGQELVTKTTKTLAKVSIIIPSYNHEAYLEQRLDSIYGQTYKNWEAIIIDDASTDNSLALIESYLKAHPSFNIKYFVKNETNTGSGYKSWQKGIELSETDYIWIAETDDYCESSFLEELVSALEENSDAILAFSGSNYVDEKGSILYNSLKRTKNLESEKNTYTLISGDKFIDELPFNTYITNGSSVIFRKPKEVIPDIIFSNKQSSDIFLWTYLLQRKTFIFNKRLLNFFRQHGDSTTVKNYKFRKKSIYIEKINYLNYFKRTEQYKILVDHFIKHYIWSNKKMFTKVGFLNTIETSDNVIFYYYKSLLKFALQKLFRYGR